VLAVLAAAGQGQRFGQRKQLVELAGKPLAAWSLEVLARSPDIGYIVIACEPDERERFQALAREMDTRASITVVEGGARRQDSVFEALRHVDDPIELAVIQDGARPFLRDGLLHEVIAKARECGGAIAAVPVKDTIKQANEAGFVQRTIPRERLWAAQTPQAFGYDLLFAAHESAEEDGFLATDDAELVERTGSIAIAIVESSYENLKITTPEDLLVAERIAARWKG
jgi:2-C-methyl-D-erythritol 4-phosphate cytidylyltransferase